MNIKNTIKKLLEKEAAFTNKYLSLETQIVLGALFALVAITLTIHFLFQ